MPDKFAFIDTNTLLHYQSFDGVDWPAILGVSSVALVFAPITIRELDVKKDEPNPKLRKRAASTLKKLYLLWEIRSVVRPNVELIIQDTESRIDYSEHELDDYRSHDDRLLASVIQFRAANVGAKIVIVTGDFGLRIKAARHGIDVICLPEELRLPEEADANEKRIQQLEREILEMKRAMPALELTFEGGLNRLEFELKPIDEPPKEEIDRLRDAIRSKHRKLGGDLGPKILAEEGNGVIGISEFAALDQFLRPSAKEFASYDRELDHFYDQYDTWLIASANYRNAKSRTVELNLALTNNGNAPAQDIDIFFHFPDGFQLFDEGSLPKGPRAPKAPEVPKGIAGLGMSLLGDYMPQIFPPPAHDFVARNYSRPKIKRTNSYEVNIHVIQLKHNLTQPLDTLYVIFDSHDVARSFCIEFEIIAGNLPSASGGKLHVIAKG